jgi:hypothetical protein
MILKLINGFPRLIGLVFINEKSNHHLFPKPKDPVRSFYFFSFYLLLNLFIVGDASNFDEYEEEARKKNIEMIGFIFVLIFDFSSYCNNGKIRQRI